MQDEIDAAIKQLLSPRCRRINCIRKVRNNYGVTTGETLSFACETSNREQLLLHLHLDTFFNTVYAIASVFVRQFGVDEPLFLQPTQLARSLITRVIECVHYTAKQTFYGKYYRFLEETMNTHRVSKLTSFISTSAKKLQEIAFSW